MELSSPGQRLMKSMDVSMLRTSASTKKKARTRVDDACQRQAAMAAMSAMIKMMSSRCLRPVLDLVAGGLRPFFRCGRLTAV